MKSGGSSKVIACETDLICPSYTSLIKFEQLILAHWIQFDRTQTTEELRTHLYRAYTCGTFDLLNPIAENIVKEWFCQLTNFLGQLAPFNLPFCSQYIFNHEQKIIGNAQCLAYFSKNWPARWQLLAGDFIHVRFNNFKEQNREIEQRYYINLTETTGTQLVLHLLHSLKSDPNLRSLIKSAKFSGPRGTCRFDNFVLFTAELSETQEQTLVRIIIDSGLNRSPKVPYMSLPIADGIAKTEHPKGSLSFGQNRCEAIAQAMKFYPDIPAVPSIESFTEEVAKFLEGYEINPQAPHLYQPLPPTQPYSQGRASSPSLSQDGDFLAADIGQPEQASLEDQL